MFDLWAEENDFGVLHDADAVTGRPVEEVIPHADLFLAAGVGEHNLARDHESPVRGVAVIVVEALEQQRDIGAGAEREIFGRQ